MGTKWTGKRQTEGKGEAEGLFIWGKKSAEIIANKMTVVTPD